MHEYLEVIGHVGKTPDGIWQARLTEFKLSGD
jgi:hypothetical protein